MASEINATSSENSTKNTIDVSIIEDPSTINTYFQEASIINTSINESSEIVSTMSSESSTIETNFVENTTQINVVTNYVNDAVLSVRVKGDSIGPQTGDVELQPEKIEHFHSETEYSQGDIVLYNYNIYEANKDFISTETFNVNDWTLVGNNLTSITSNDNSVDITTISNSVDISVKKIVDEEKVRAELVEKTLQDLIDTKVDKVEGKSLSSNDFTNEYKNKLDSIEQGAEINVQSDYAETNQLSDSFIKNKPNIYTKEEQTPELVTLSLDNSTIKKYSIITLND
jgi:hypothetical protein